MQIIMQRTHIMSQHALQNTVDPLILSVGSRLEGQRHVLLYSSKPAKHRKEFARKVRIPVTDYVDYVINIAMQPAGIM